MLVLEQMQPSLCQKTKTNKHLLHLEETLEVMGRRAGSVSHPLHSHQTLRIQDSRLKRIIKILCLVFGRWGE